MLSLRHLVQTPLFISRPCIISSFSTFKTAVSKSERMNSNLHSERNLKKDYLRQKGKSHSSTIWLDRQLRDPFTIRAKEEGYRSRAVYKLKEIDEKFKLFHNGNVVVDVGAAPGGWSQYCVQKTGISIPSSVISIDLLPIEPLTGVHCIQGNFLDDAMKDELEYYIDNRKVDTVMSDIAPNFSGDHNIDHLKQIDMCKDVIKFAHKVAKKDCTLVLKVLQGSEFQSYIKQCKSQFKEVHLMKPKASHKESTEIYCILKHFLSLVSLNKHIIIHFVICLLFLEHSPSYFLASQSFE